jgi:hypothetical protein
MKGRKDTLDPTVDKFKIEHEDPKINFECKETHDPSRA